MRLSLQIENSNKDQYRESQASIPVRDDEEVTNVANIDETIVSPKDANVSMINADNSPLSPYKQGRNGQTTIGDSSTGFH